MMLNSHGVKDDVSRSITRHAVGSSAARYGRDIFTVADSREKIGMYAPGAQRLSKEYLANIFQGQLLAVGPQTRSSSRQGTPEMVYIFTDNLEESIADNVRDRAGYSGGASYTGYDNPSTTNIIVDDEG